MDDAIRNIEEMEEKIRVLTRKKDLLKEICKKAGKEIKALKQSNVDLKNTLDKILDTLDGDSFSKDWEEYQKYN